MLQAIFSIDPRILATSVALLAVALGLLVRRRIAVARERRERLELEAADVSGETSVLPLAQLASSVEVLDLDELLAGEEGSVVAAARRQLEAPTDVRLAPDTVFPIPPAPVARPAVAGMQPTGAAMQPAAMTVPPATHVGTAAAAAVLARRPQAAAAAPSGAPSGVVQGRPAAAERGGTAPPERPVPVRELALAWFEARGYRPSAASQAVRPIELVLRHQKDPGRAYAFIVERERVTAERIAALVEHAQSIGLTRVLVAAENGSEPGILKLFRRQGVRLVDQDEMRREFEKLDLGIAAKIIAVARSRARLRSSSA